MDPSTYQSWDRVIFRFLKRAGLLQALNGFENDMLVMNPDFEKDQIPLALQDLRVELMRLSQSDLHSDSTNEDRKLQYIHLGNGETPLSQNQLTRSISTLLAQNRVRNNASNQSEFLRKRRRVQPDVNADMDEGSSTVSQELPTCARTDAIPVNRDVQMKYDVAKNEAGPLRRTVKSEDISRDKPEDRKGKGRMTQDDLEVKPTLEKHPGLRERFSNLETHLAVRYVPSPPVSLLDRIRFIEDHVMNLEREYPPWAALHFNQPNRGWPPPPRTNPLIVPSHMTSTLDPLRPTSSNVRDPSMATPSAVTTGVMDTTSQSGGARSTVSRPKPKTKSTSLHRAVMDKLEVKKALAGED